jgi:hypothetical protein
VAADVAEVALAVRFKLFSGVGPLTDLGGSGFVVISGAGLGSLDEERGRWGVVAEGSAAGGKCLPWSAWGSGGVAFWRLWAERVLDWREEAGVSNERVTLSALVCRGGRG